MALTEKQATLRCFVEGVFLLEAGPSSFREFNSSANQQRSCFDYDQNELQTSLESSGSKAFPLDFNLVHSHLSGRLWHIT